MLLWCWFLSGLNICSQSGCSAVHCMGVAAGLYSCQRWFCQIQGLASAVGEPPSPGGAPAASHACPGPVAAGVEQ